MPTKSPITWLLTRIALFSAMFTVVSVANVTAQSRPFLNVSARAQVLTGDNVVISGFIISTTATTTKQVLIRGLGPSTGVKFSLADPVLTLNGPNGLIYSNNNWRDTQEVAIQATGFAPGNNLDSAILWTLPPGNYTATLAGNNGGTGVGVIEIYDMSGPAPIVNLSARALVGTGNNVLIGGVIIGAPGTRAVVRGIGPSLTQFGIQGALQNPTLELYNSSGTLLASNDNWASGPDQAEISYLGLAPTYANESTLLATLGVGNYTAIVKGVNNTTGVGMVELYALPDPKCPKIFQAWGDADNLSPEDINVTRARHDLLIHVDVAFGYNWVDGNGQTTTDYTSETISQNGIIYYSIPTLRGLNPNMKILVQVAHYGMDGNRLPANHAWWKRDINGNRIPSIFGGNDFQLDQDNPSLRTHVGNQSAALMATGQFDGIFLDTTPAGTSYLAALVTAVRSAIGQNGLIMVQPNSSELTPQELSPVNGVYMECGKIGSGLFGHPDWQVVKAALLHNETYTRNPKVNCLENWFITSRTAPGDLKRMRATTTLALTLSNGYALFGDPDDLPSNHLHNWYDFWSNHSLGVPIGTGTNMPGNYAVRREFKNGTAIWNAAQNTTLPVSFPQMRRSLATGQTGFNFNLTGIDGDIYLFLNP